MKQLGELKVADYMTEQAIVIADTKKLTSAIGLMDGSRFSALPVVDEQNQVIGLLSSSDLIGLTHELQSDIGSLHMVNQSTREFLIHMLMEQGDCTIVRDVMTQPVETIKATANLVVAAKILTERQFHHLPVVDELDKPVGIISTADFVRAIADYGALLAG